MSFSPNSHCARRVTVEPRHRALDELIEHQKQDRQGE
jgi:hypothetical protein